VHISNGNSQLIVYFQVRSEFDEILLRHATESGAAVYEGVQVTGIQFSGERPISATWKSDMGSTGELGFNWLVDASGRTGIMSTKYLRNRRFNQSLKNVAFWGYWNGANMYAPGTKRENAPWFEALTGELQTRCAYRRLFMISDESGWAWFIPLHNDTVSVGVVMKEEFSRIKKSKLSGPEASSKTHYHIQLLLAPGVVNLLGNAKLISEVKSAGDYSYSAGTYAGPNYRIAGDAGGK
jgi:flavin-dependent dehydrogenase